MSLLDQVVGHAIPRGVITRALETGKKHHAYLFEGPESTGRELCARAFAQAMVCEAPNDKGLACGTCSPCSRVPGAGLPAHPDVVLVGKGLYEPGQIGRKSPETQDISVDQVRTLVLARAAFGPHEGRARVIIIKRAEELSTSAANALLKTLEEPLPKTHFILLTARPDTLLPTIRSRTLHVRFGPLGRVDLEQIANASPEANPKALDLAVIAGSTEPLFDKDNELADRAAAFIERAQKAASAKDFLDALDLGADAKKERDGLEEMLGRFASTLALAARTADQGAALRLARQHEHVLSALTALDGNVAPQLALERMFSALRAATG
jgi:DNA polymerase III subunit delta'